VQGPKNVSEETSVEPSESSVSAVGVTLDKDHVAGRDSDTDQTMDAKDKPGESVPISQAIPIGGPREEPLDGEQITSHQPAGEPPIGESKNESPVPGSESPPVSADSSDSIGRGERYASVGETSAKDDELTDKVNLEPATEKPQASLPDQRQTPPKGEGKSQQIPTKTEKERTDGTPETSAQEKVELPNPETKSGETEDSGTK